MTLSPEEKWKMLKELGRWQVFELSDVARMVGLPISKAKNWSIGKPLSITPSVREAQGTGSRSLYSMDDVYRMAVANEMSKLGLPTKAIEAVLQLLKMEFSKPEGSQVLRKADWLLIWRKTKEWAIEFRSGPKFQFTPTLENGLVLVVLDLKTMVQRLDDRSKEKGGKR